jgi:superfamily I DNA and RNA helicase
LLGLIGQAEMKKEIEGIVKEITQRKTSLERESHIPITLDEKALKKYISYVIKETKKGEKDERDND